NIIILETKNVSKEFPGVKALNNVLFNVKKGEIHAIVGENGSGKSTLIKIITGAYQPLSGEIYFENKKIENNNPQQSINNGISTIYQEFNLFYSLTIMENMFYGQEIVKYGLLDKKSMIAKCKSVLSELEIDLSPNYLIKDLSVAYRQLVEIAKAIFRDIKLLIMDEPTAPLTQAEIDVLFKVINKLKDKGVSIIYISHRIEEVFQLSDRVTVLRDGECTKTLQTADTDKKELIKLMIGREISSAYPSRNPIIDEPILRVEGLTNNKIKNITFDLMKKEILGVAGLVGAGRTEMARAIFGADTILKGNIYLNGKRVCIKTPVNAIKNRIGMIPEDRMNQGLILKLSVKFNICYSALASIIKNFFINNKLEENTSNYFCEKLKIKVHSIHMKTMNLSGGNQQKVVLAKWLATKSDILIFDEPTRGIDVGAKQEIYLLMEKLIEEGKSIIMISSDLPELIGMSNRIIVLRKGELVGELKGTEITQEKVLSLAANY
ncbi:MAG: sugar ABC transporter ATP-binding protein, partial [Actinomycetota bacterium]